MHKMRKRIKSELDKARYEHTLGVMYTAAALAMCHGADIEQAMTAGLLHDCAKCIPTEKKIKLCGKYHLNISEVEYANPSLLHAKLGAALAARKYKVKDRDIIKAIASHTTGRPQMSLLEQIIYIADYIEPGRTEIPNLEDVRALAFRNMEDCLYRILKDSLAYLNTRNFPIDPMTQKTYDYYKEKTGRKEDESWSSPEI